jgi:hypothetical protein
VRRSKIQSFLARSWKSLRVVSAGGIETGEDPDAAERGALSLQIFLDHRERGRRVDRADNGGRKPGFTAPTDDFSRAEKSAGESQESDGEDRHAHDGSGVRRP